MEKLTARERELVAIGASIASNCIPCIEYHIPKAKEAGLTDSQITEAVRYAEKVKKVPAEKVMTTAMGLVQSSKEEVCTDPDCACHQSSEATDASPCCS